VDTVAAADTAVAAAAVDTAAAAAVVDASGTKPTCLGK
jgi:hypothetical protein